MPAEFETFYVVLAVVAGLVFGSFLNVCVYRIPRDLSIIFPRSFCPECGKEIAWYDNIPVLSYAVLHGRCRSCRKAIGFRYPAVELMTAGLFAAVTLRYGWNLAALKWAIFESCCIVLFWTDFEERILPDEITLGGTVVGLVLAFFVAVPGGSVDLLFSSVSVTTRSLLNAVLGATVFAGLLWGLGSLYSRIRRREALGLGDVKLLLFLGVFLGFDGALTALLIGAVSGALLGGIFILVRRKEAATYELPFGSFLCLGAAITPFLKHLAT